MAVRSGTDKVTAAIRMTACTSCERCRSTTSSMYRWSWWPSWGWPAPAQEPSESARERRSEASWFGAPVRWIFLLRISLPIRAPGSRAAANQPGYRQKPFSLPLYWQHPRTLFSFCNSIDLSKVQSVDRLTNGCALECGVGFHQLRTCRRARPGQLSARGRNRSRGRAPWLAARQIG